MNKLWFPVKLGPSLHGVLGAKGVTMFVFALACAGCGYHSAYGGPRPSGRLSVVAAATRSPESGALVAVLGGLRGELSRAGVLVAGSGFPRVVVELVRVDERGTAQSMVAQAGGSELPLASGALIGVTARAWVEPAENRAERDTGDVRRTSGFASAANEALDAARREVAIESAGRSTGEALGRRIMGEVEVTQEPM